MKLTATPDWLVGTAWLPPGMVMAKFEPWLAEVWADIHEFEHTRHRVRLFEQTRSEGLKEIADWRDQCA